MMRNHNDSKSKKANAGTQPGAGGSVRVWADTCGGKAAAVQALAGGDWPAEVVELLRQWQPRRSGLGQLGAALADFEDRAREAAWRGERLY